MDAFAKIAERKIREAQSEGAFNNLPGKGKPLVLDDFSQVPPELRMCYKILKNAGVLPEEMQIRKEMLRLQDLIRICEDDEEKQEHGRKLSLIQLRLEMLLQKSGRRLPAAYEARAFEKLT